MQRKMQRKIQRTNILRFGEERDTKEIAKKKKKRKGANTIDESSDDDGL
jgi:hypothetical protein